MNQSQRLKRQLFPITSLVALALASACASTQEKDSADTRQFTQANTAPSTSGKTFEVQTPGPVEASPLTGAKLFVDPNSLAMLTANSLRSNEPEKAKILDKIAEQPMALWMGEWNSNIYRAVEHYVDRATNAGAVPTMIAYNIPMRDCLGHSEGGLSKDDYQRWIRDIHAGIGNRSAVVVLEPDALGHLQECLSDDEKNERMFLLDDAVKVLRQNDRTAVYLDAGHARWVEAEEMADRLKKAGIEHAHGFSLNVSNYVSTEENLEYGRTLSALTGDKRFIIDTSRNGAGPYEGATTAEESWCNPPGRKIGQAPTTSTGDELCQGFLWLKRPGESDGQCNGGPVAGAFWLEQALKMASK